MSAKIISKVEETLKTIIVKHEVPAGVQLNLTLEQAFALVEVFSQVGGCEETTAREYINEIRQQLYHLGIKWQFGRNGVFKSGINDIIFTYESASKINQLVEQFKELKVKKLDS